MQRAFVCKNNSGYQYQIKIIDMTGLTLFTKPLLNTGIKQDTYHRTGN